MIQVSAATTTIRPKRMVKAVGNFFGIVFSPSQCPSNKVAGSRRRTGSAAKMLLQARPGGIQRHGGHDPRVAAIGEAAPHHAFVVVEVGIPVANVEGQRLPAVGNTGRPGELLEGFGIFEELVADAGIDREIMRQRHLDAACDERRGLSALVVVRSKEDPRTEGEPVVEVVVGLGEQLAIVGADVLGGVEVVDVAEVDDSGPNSGRTPTAVSISAPSKSSPKSTLEDQTLT